MKRNLEVRRTKRRAKPEQLQRLQKRAEEDLKKLEDAESLPKTMPRPGNLNEAPHRPGLG